MKMREWYDAQTFKGAWDELHDSLNGYNDRFDLPTPRMVVEGVEVSIFPGENREVTYEEVQQEISRALKAIENGDFEKIEQFNDSHN